MSTAVAPPSNVRPPATRALSAESSSADSLSAGSLDSSVTTPHESVARTGSAWPVRDETITVHDVVLESGALVQTIDVHYRLEGALSPTRDNLVLVVHALTGTTHASDWWKGVIDAGGAIDPTRHAILCANLLGGCDGTTGPTNANPTALPRFTTRDQAVILARLLDSLDVEQPLLVCGGSLGGMVTLEFAATFPERVRAAVVLAAPAAQTAQGIAWGAIMERAIAIGGVQHGLALARMVGMLSYRTPEGLERRFGRARRANGEFLVKEWLASHGEKLVQRFDATSFTALLAAMDSHDVGRGRGGIAAALAPVADRLTGVGIPGDLLYPAESVREWTSGTGATYLDLPSVHGHDAFLLETARVSAFVADAIARAEARSAVARDATQQTRRKESSPSSLAATQSAPGARWTRAVVTPRALGFEARGLDVRNIDVRDLDVRALESRSIDNRRSGAPLSDHRAGAGRDESTRALRVALAGCGHVGGSLLDLFGECAGERPPGNSPQVRVERVLVRDGRRPRPALAQAIARGLAPANACITDPASLVNDDIDVLVEAIGGTTTARTLVETALRRGIRVVTANKALLAERGAHLAALARTNGTRIDFEGAVAGAIPVVRCLRSGAAGIGITRFSGILNGTSNFVLDCVAEGASLADAIATAQRLGYAEADPTRDLSGEDVEDKLRVLAWLSFGVDPASLKVTRRGIDAETAAWAAQVAAEGDRVKLLATCRREHDEYVAQIIPTRVTADDAWANVTGAFNRIVIESASAGSIAFQGPGAGGRPTAGAVLGDVLAQG